MLNHETRPKNLADMVTPEIIGLFWITAAPLSRELSSFDQLNYLFDGLLSQMIYGESSSKSRANIFFTDNFNQTLFLAHLNTEGSSKSEISGEIDEQVALIQSNAVQRKKVLVLNSDKVDWVSELSKRYSQFEFISISLD